MCGKRGGVPLLLGITCTSSPCLDFCQHLRLELSDEGLCNTASKMAGSFRLSNVYLISFLATLGGLMQGFDVASMSAIIGTPQVSVKDSSR